MNTNLPTLRLFTTTKIYNVIVANVQEIKNIKEFDKHILRYLYTAHRIIAHKTKLHKTIDYKGCRIHLASHAKALGLSNQDAAIHIRHLIQWGMIFKSDNEIPQVKSAAYMLNNEYSSDTIVIADFGLSDPKILNCVDTSITEDKNESVFMKKSLEILQGGLKINRAGINYLKNKYENNNKSNCDQSSFYFISEEDYNEIKSSSININNNKYLPSYNSIFPSYNNNINVLPIDGSFGNNNTKSVIYKRLNVVFSMPIEIRDVALYKIYAGEFYCSRPDVKSRVYNNLTNLPREHRKYITFRGKPMLMTDISNSQIILSVPAILETYHTLNPDCTTLPEDIVEFQKVCENGIFYESVCPEIYRHTFQDKQVRNDFKEDFFAQVWFNKTTAKSKKIIRNLFQKKYPTVWKIIAKLKGKNYKDFSINLQRFEASIMIDEVATEMLNRKRIILTLHDAIICSNKKDLELAEKLIAKQFWKYQIKPSFKREITMKRVHISVGRGVVITSPSEKLKYKHLTPLPKQNYTKHSDSQT